jgi:hypothetical protein
VDAPDADMADWFRRARDGYGARVVRFWASQSSTSGGTDWRAMARVMRLARAYDLKVIPVPPAGVQLWTGAPAPCAGAGRRPPVAAGGRVSGRRGGSPAGLLGYRAAPARMRRARRSPRRRL